jgi:hypothetical protein
MAKAKENEVPKVPEVVRYNTKREATKAALDAQPKVQLIVPKIEGQAPDYDVVINGVAFRIEAGKKCMVPEQVAEIMNERLMSEGWLQNKSQEDATKLASAGI